MVALVATDTESLDMHVLVDGVLAACLLLDVGASLKYISLLWPGLECSAHAEPASIWPSIKGVSE